jgi:hypothetical protein
MVARTNKRSVKKGLELSKIFGDLPDMLKQQVLEFAAPTKDPFFLGYSPKTKTFVKQVNKSFMKDMLEYKINNPPVRTEIGEHFIQIRISPPKLPFYEVNYCNSNINMFGWYSIIFVHSKYMRLRTLLKNKCIKNKKILMNSTNVINEIGIVYGF